MNNNQRWSISVWSRFFGIVLTFIFVLFTLNAKDIWLHAIIQVVLIIGVFYFVFVLPDKIVFGKYLKKRRVADGERK
jgi:hypothetical protein